MLYIGWHIAWHLIPTVKHVWQRKGLPGGKPPCLCCVQHVQVAADSSQCYEQLSAAEVKQLQAEGKLGKTTCHGWLRTPHRAAGVDQPDLLMAFQYCTQTAQVTLRTAKADMGLVVVVAD